MKWAIKNIGFVFFGLCACLLANSIDNQRDALKQNTLQIASAVTCRGDHPQYAENMLAATINSSQLRPVERRMK